MTLPPFLRVCQHVFATATTAAVLLLTLAAVGFFTPTSAQAQHQRLITDDYTGIQFGPNSAYGSVMVSSGDWMAISAPGTATDRFSSYAGGRVTLWKRDAPTGTWELRQELRWPDASIGSGNQFGRTLALAGDRLLVGSAITATRVHVYRRENDTWALDGTLTSPGGSSTSRFGDGLAVSGDLAVVGSPVGDAGTPTGWLDVYLRSHSGWLHQTRLTDAVNGTGLGQTVAIHGSLIFAGRPLGDITSPTMIPDAGKITVFGKPAATWVKTGEILSSNPSGNERLGLKLQVHGDRLYALGNGPLSLTTLHEFAITSGFASVNRLVISLTNAASALLTTNGTNLALHNGGSSDPFIYRRTSGEPWVRDTSPWQSASAITETALLWSGDDLLMGGSVVPYTFSATELTVRVMRKTGTTWGIAGHYQPPIASRLSAVAFGHSLARDGEWLVTGAPIYNYQQTEDEGLAFVYRRTEQATYEFHSILPQPVQPGVNLRHFGRQATCSGGLMAVGSSLAVNANTYHAPSAVFLYAWDLAQERWVQEATLTAPLGRSGHGFGQSLVLSGGLLAVGSPADRAVYLYRRVLGQWTLETQLHLPAASPGAERFGWALSLQGTRLLVGSPTSSSGPGSGAAYLFELSGGIWIQTARLQPPASSPLSQPGTTVNLDADRALLGGTGTPQAALFQRSGTTWKHQVNLTGFSTAPVVASLLAGPLALLDNGDGTALHVLVKDKWLASPFSHTQGGISATSLALDGRRLIVGSYRLILVENLTVSPSNDWQTDGSLINVDGNEVTLDVGEYLTGKTAPRVVGFRLQPNGAFPVRSQVTLTGNTADFSLAKATWDVSPGTEILEWLRFHPTTPGLKVLKLTFTSDAPQDTPRVYHIFATAVTTATPMQFTGVPDSVLMGTFDLEHSGVPLEPVVTGTGPWTFRWLKNGAAIPGATSRTFTVNTPGAYHLDATGAAGRLRSPVINIGSYELKTPVLLALPGETVRGVMAVAGPGVKVSWKISNAGDVQPLSDGASFAGEFVTRDK